MIHLLSPAAHCPAAGTCLISEPDAAQGLAHRSLTGARDSGYLLLIQAEVRADEVWDI